MCASMERSRPKLPMFTLTPAPLSLSGRGEHLPLPTGERDGVRGELNRSNMENTNANSK